MHDDSPPASRTRARKAPKPVTQAYLERVALFYLERYASSAENLRRVLMRRVERSCRHHGTDSGPFAGMVETLVARYAGAGLVDDKRYADTRAAALRRRGGSARSIALKLKAKGVPADLVAPALAESGTDEAGAALALARRRRLGPFRPPEARRDHREKDMAALARGGFDYDIARKIVDGDGTLPEE